MRLFFRKMKKNTEIKREDNIILTHDLVNTEDNLNDNTEIKTELSIHPSWKLSMEQTYVYRYLNNELAPLKPNQISLAGIELNHDGEDLQATAFIRNSLPKTVTFEKVTLLLLDDQRKIIARNDFDLSKLGNLPGESSRPWQFTFPKDSIIKSNFPTKDWTVVFELKKRKI